MSFVKPILGIRIEEQNKKWRNTKRLQIGNLVEDTKHEIKWVERLELMKSEGR
jgi:hypothetical protein